VLVDAERIDRFRQAARTSNRQGPPAGDVPAPVTCGRQGEPGELESVDPAGEAGPVDVRQEPLAVRDGCAPDRIPIGRWPSDDALVRSEQFAVNEAVRQLADANPGGLLAVHAPPGTGVAEVFGDLVAAIVTERARRIAELPDPAAAFEASRTWGGHIVAAPAPSLTGFEIVLAAPEASAPTAHGLPPIGTRWRDAAGSTDYFASTARLADGVGAWAMLAARLGDGPANRAFAERWWRGTVRGTDVLFPAGESMSAVLRRLRQDREVVDWPAAVARFRSAAAKAESLAAERARVAASLTRLSALEQACEEASGTAETGQATLADLTAREPSVRAAVLAAEEDRRTRLAELGAHELDRPALATVTASGKAALRTSSALSIAVAGGLRRGKNWRDWSVTRRELRAACVRAQRRRDAAARESEALRAGLAAARKTVDRAIADVTRFTAELGPLAEAVGVARQRWGDHVPDGPSQAETEDAALIEWRETSAPWADVEYATARASVFLAALELHKALISARADVLEANLGTLMDLLCAQNVDEGALRAAWQSFFLVVPVVHVAFEAAGTLFGSSGPLGWLLADAAERLPAQRVHDIRGLFKRAVLTGDTLHASLAGDTIDTGPTGDTLQAGKGGLGFGSAQRIAERAARYGTWLPSGRAGGRASGQPSDQPESAVGAGRVWIGMPLRVVRGLDRATVDLRNDLAYDGLLISDQD
jgi:hypothetical protein